MLDAVLIKADNPDKKFTVYLENNGKIKKINFGASGMDDYTLTNDNKAKERYINRHQKRENWDNPSTAGFWSKHILWEKKTIVGSIKKIEKDYDIRILNMI